MSRSKESKQINRQAGQEYERINKDYGQYTQKREGLADEARGRSNEAYGRARQGYEDWLGAYGPGGTAGTPGFGSRSSGYWRRLADTGGLDEENKRRIRGGGVFDEFAKTGGLSDTQRQDFRQRATRTIPSFYENIRNELDRTRKAQGGYAPGFDEQMAKAAREEGYASQDAALDAETNLTNMINEGRRWGAGSMSSAELGLGDLLQRGLIEGAGGLQRDDALSAQAEIQNRGLNLQALEGLRGLRTDAPGEVFGYEDLIAGGMGGRTAGIGNNLSQRMQYNPNRGFWDYATPLIGGGLSAAATYFGGPGGAMAGGGGGGFGSYAQGQQGGTSGGYANIPTRTGVGYQVNLPTYPPPVRYSGRY